MDKAIHYVPVIYVNEEAYSKYILWRCCYYERSSKHEENTCPVSHIFSCYHSLAIQHNFSVKSIHPRDFGHFLHSFKKERILSLFMQAKESGTSTVPWCSIDVAWAQKYERLLHTSIERGCVDMTLGLEAISEVAVSRGILPRYATGNKYDPGEYEKTHGKHVPYLYTTEEEYHPRACESEPPTASQQKTYDYLEQLKRGSAAFTEIGTFNYATESAATILDSVQRANNRFPVPQNTRRRNRFPHQDNLSCIVIISKYVSRMHLNLEMRAIATATKKGYEEYEILRQKNTREIEHVEQETPTTFDFSALTPRNVPAVSFLPPPPTIIEVARKRKRKKKKKGKKGQKRIKSRVNKKRKEKGKEVET